MQTLRRTVAVLTLPAIAYLGTGCERTDTPTGVRAVALVADPACSVRILPMLTDQERRQMLVEWNHTCADYPRDCLIHELFEMQVNRSPDAVAVT